MADMTSTIIAGIIAGLAVAAWNFWDAWRKKKRT